MGKIFVNNKEEIEYINRELFEIGLELPDFLLSLVLNLHWKYLATKGLAPKDEGFDKILEEMKKKVGAKNSH